MNISTFSTMLRDALSSATARSVVLLRLVRHLALTFCQGAATALDKRVFPGIVRFATNRWHIALLIVLWFALLIFGSITVLALTGGNYFNGLCGIVSCVLLSQQMAHHHENKRLHAQHAEEIAALHAKLDALTPPPSSSPLAHPRRAAHKPPSA